MMIVPAFVLTSCINMENPFFHESSLPYGAPEFDRIKLEHYLPAFERGLEEGKANIDKIVESTEEPTFRNVIVPMEFATPVMDRASGVFFALLEADTNPGMEALAEKIYPLLTEYSLYVSLNEKLFNKVKKVYDGRKEAGLEPNEVRLVEQTYRSFVRGGALLSVKDKKKFSELSEKSNLLSLQFGKNLLAATNAYTLNVTDSSRLAGMPAYVLTAAKECAQEKGQEGWSFTLQYPSFGPFLKHCADRELRREMYMAYNTRALGGEYDNCHVLEELVKNRIERANLLGYDCYADYELEERMAKDRGAVEKFLMDLMKRSLPYAQKEVAEIQDYASKNGFDGKLQAWDFSFWSERLKEDRYSISDEELKPYFELNSCIDAVFSLASRLYSIHFDPISLPVYHKDVKVYDVKDLNGRHLALFYADFFPRESKRGGAWMTEFRGQSIENGVEKRPFITIVCNFTKPTAEDPSLITHDELVTFMHEFGHSLHGILAEGELPGQTGTNVARDFVEFPSQFNENWAYEKEFLDGFAKHYKTGETIPDALVDKIIAAKNYMSGYLQVRQLQLGIVDMAWHTLKKLPEENAQQFEKKVLHPYMVLPEIDRTGICQTFSHLFNGGYAAGYYSYKWAEVLEADAFELFLQSGIFDKTTAESFKTNILQKGDTEDPAELFRAFRGRDPENGALMRKLGLE